MITGRRAVTQQGGRASRVAPARVESVGTTVKRWWLTMRVHLLETRILSLHEAENGALEAANEFGRERVLEEMDLLRTRNALKRLMA